MQQQTRTAARPPAVEGLSPQERRALSHLWLAVACSRQSAVPSLAQLVRVLCALGGPLDLVERAALAAADATRHARTAAGLATVYAGAPATLPALSGVLAVPPAHGPRRALGRLAVTAYREGCLVAGHTAQVATWAAATAEDPAVRAALATVAAEEALHTALWEDVLAWCLEVRPKVRRRLRRLDLPTTSPVLAAYRGLEVDPGVLTAHGCPRPQDVARLWAAHRAGVVARLAGRD